MLINAYWDSPHGRNIDWSVFVYNTARLSNRTFQRKRDREREKKLVTHSWMNIHFLFFFFYGDQLFFSGFTASLPVTFLIHACCDFYQTTFGLKMSRLRRGKKSLGEEKAIKMMWLSHHAACCPLSLHHQSFPSPLAMMLFLCHPT